ncbi:MAG: enoyl-CoA hydratase-related protein [Thermodesulfobacteriota bacterium]|nr:enoyl-CoA hydratase-related protein [Thermodesulfobacteriota bacterium]
MEQKLAYYEIRDQIAIVTIDHPPMNALDAATKEAIVDVFKELDDRRQEIRAVILHGAGEKAFAAGADIKTFLELKPGTAKRRISRTHQIYSMVRAVQISSNSYDYPLKLLPFWTSFGCFENQVSFFFFYVSIMLSKIGRF